jgi:hypothetical protein
VHAKYGEDQRTFLWELIKIGSWIPKRLRIIHWELAKVQLWVIGVPALGARAHVGISTFNN